MKKVISAILSIAIIGGLITVPVYADISTVYSEVLRNAVELYGEYEEQSYCNSTGVGYVGEFDFDGDGINELLFCTGEKTANSYEYNYHIYAYQNGAAVLLDEGSMDAHSGDTDWVIDIVHTEEMSRVLTYRYDGMAANTEHITVGEYYDGEWHKHEDMFVGDYNYNNFYINGQPVSESEYNINFDSLSNSGKTEIRYINFDGSYAEEYGQSFSDSSYWQNKKNSAVVSAASNVYEPLTENDVKTNYSEYYNMVYEEMDCLYVYPFDGVYHGLTFRDDEVKYDRVFKQVILPTFNIFAMEHGSEERLNVLKQTTTNPQLYDYVDVYDRHVLETAISTKLGEDYLFLLDSSYEGIDYIDDNYVVIWVGGRGESYPLYHYVIDAARMLSDTDMYLEWHIESYDGTERSDTVYNILRETELFGKTLIIPDYLSLDAPSDEFLVSYGNGSKNDDITVKLNDEPIQFEAQPVIYNERTLVPMRAIFEALGADVDWNGDTQTVTATSGKTTIIITINSSTMYINGAGIEIDAPPMLIGDYTYVPVRVIAESFNSEVGWDGDTRTVLINTDVKNTNTPKPTVTPKPTATPKPTKTPKPTSVPKSIKTPKATATPEPRENSILTLYTDSNVSYKNGEKQYIDAENLNVMPVVIDGRTLVPIRYIAEAFGGSVDWDSDTKKATINVGDNEIKLFANKNYILINGMANDLDIPAQIIEGRTMIPLRAFAEAIGQSVEYYNGLIIIGTKELVADMMQTDLDKYISGNFAEALIPSDTANGDSELIELFAHNYGDANEGDFDK